MLGILPKDTAFFQLFEKAAENVHAGAACLDRLLESFTAVQTSVNHLKQHEHRGDQITHETLQKLNSCFVTPIDREDIQALMSRLDDIIDLIDSAGAFMLLYAIDRPTDHARALGKVLLKAAGTTEDAVRGLRSLKRPDEILKLCVIVHTHENEGDKIYHQALGALFDAEHPVLDVIKWKDIYWTLEEATNRCEDVANILEGIVLKNV